MKKRARALSAILAATMILTLAMTAMAASATVDTTIYYNGITLELNGIPVSIRRSDPDRPGVNPSQLNEVLPFVLDGTTCLSLRAVATLFDKNVSWDPKTHTIYLTSQNPTGAPVVDGETTVDSDVVPAGDAASDESEMLLVLDEPGVMGAAPGTTDSGAKAVKIYYKNIKVVLDGVTLSLKDANGNVVEPFIMDDVGYLPLRAVANIFGVEVNWNAQSNTIKLTTDQNLSALQKVQQSEATEADNPGLAAPPVEEVGTGETEAQTPVDDTAAEAETPVEEARADGASAGAGGNSA